MAWTWEKEKSLGLAHLEHMAQLERRFEANWRESAARATALADGYARHAEAWEQAAREVRAAAAEPALALPFHPTVMCGISTAAGLPCTRRTLAEGDRCWQHKDADA